MEADLSAGDGSASVRVAWVLIPWPEGSPAPMDRPVPIELLGFGPATAEAVVLDDGRTLRLEPDGGTHRSAVLRPAVDAARGPLEVVFSYRVASAAQLEDASVRARIPVLTGPLMADVDRRAAAAETGGEGSVGSPAFAARVRLPEAWTVADGFPSGLRRAEDGSYTVSLPVPPAMVGFRARTDGVWHPGLPFFIDVLTITVLIGFAVVGWRHLSSVAATSRAA
jgi:hypothetical protein